MTSAAQVMAPHAGARLRSGGEARLSWRLAPTLAAVVGAAAYLIADPRLVDLAAHVYRTRLFERHGFTIWDGNWYAGHHTPGYSVLFPPLASLLGTTLAGALSAVAAAALFEALVRARFGDRARLGALWFGVGSATLLFTGRLPFALGVALGLAALLALERRRASLAIPLAVACAVASPVAGLFLALVGLTWALFADHGRAIALALAAALPPVILEIAFPEGGFEPFSLESFLPLAILSLASALLVPWRERALCAGACIYAAAGTAAYLIHTAMGSNAVRLGALVGGPLVACAISARGRVTHWSGPRRRVSGIVARRRVRAAATLALLAGLAWWQWSPAIGDVEKVSSQPAAHAPFFRPLLDHLAHAGGPAARVEIPFTKLHWEAAAVAPRFPLARGWERQLDIARNGLFYGRAPLTAATYETWLEAHAVGWVALARTDLDYSAQREAALIGRGLPYLKLRWRSRDWRLYEFTGAHALVISQGGARLRLARLENGAVVLAVARPGRALVRVAWSPYWELRGGCVEQAGQWTQVEAHRTGLLRMSISFSLARVFVHGRRCGR